MTRHSDNPQTTQTKERHRELNPHHPLRGVYAITNEHLQRGGDLINAVEQALVGGAALIQYRNKTASFADKVNEAAQLKSLCQTYGARLLINDDIDLCQAVDADGVHLGQSDTGLLDARERLGARAIIGISCHNSDELVQQAVRNHADYIALGRFFPSLTKPGAPPATLMDLQRIRAMTTLPIVAIGGVSAENGALLVEHGANMLAAINYIFSADDISNRVHALNNLFKARQF
ncbi:thiamine phosphate synthase [Pseudohongiella spirulinae]|uniref:Thiamine-phosphate synthase n=1 Tax=Pseudohongiella spirulinae TaxID=1249552 RepID=A0A0S2KFK7_9GAMM|nr:thiamine phosphate synthase [Pseudohongiella spirulinae]ALO47127.1 Thiamine-phosphate pyrophosphorylase [Pseudohongiella spirulinae]